jgi:hypothetical protein
MDKAAEDGFGDSREKALMHLGYGKESTLLQ